MKFDVDKIRRDFPILSIEMGGHPLVYLDSAATSQKPRQVINAITRYYKKYNANIHRGIYDIAEQATEEYTESKELLAKFIGAHSYREIVYVRNTTEAINLVALTWGEANIKKGDHILISKMEHHSNLVPWLMLAKRKGAVLDYIELKDESFIDIDDYKEKLEMLPKLVAFTHVSNVLGTINDAEYMTRLAHAAGAKVLVDGAQSAPHMKVDIENIGCDFFALSGHKMLAPLGIGALYAKEEILESTEPLYGGGDMINSVEFQSCTWNELPWKFEAGTQNIEGAIGLTAAIKYLNKIGIDNIREHEKQITTYALKRLGETNGVRIYGPSYKDIDRKAGVVSFNVEGIHPHDLSEVFNGEGIAIRSGHHCAMPLVTNVLGTGAVARASFYLYNKEEEIDRMIEAIGKAQQFFKRHS